MTYITYYKWTEYVPSITHVESDVLHQTSLCDIQRYEPIIRLGRFDCFLVPPMNIRAFLGTKFKIGGSKK